MAVRHKGLIDSEYLRFRDGEVGRDEFFAHVYEALLPGLRTFCYRFLGDTEAEDVASNAVMMAYMKVDSYSADGRNGYKATFSTWLYTIAANLCKSELRRRKRRNMVSIAESSDEYGLFVYTDDGRSVVEPAENKDIASDTRTALERIPVIYRDAIVMRYVDDMSYHDMSIILGIPIGTMKSRVSRARTAFSRVYGMRNKDSARKAAPESM